MKALLVILALSASLNVTLAKPATFYVATNGNDGWSGLKTSPSADSKDGPFASLDAALAAARQARKNAADPVDSVTIWIRSGSYELSHPLRLTPEDSGISAEKPFTIAAYQNESPTISGGRRLTGWRQVDGTPGLWQTEIPAVKSGEWYFRQLFVNGQRKQRARTPNEGFFRIQGNSPDGTPGHFNYKPGDLKPEWAKDKDVEVIALLAWADLRMHIQSIDETSHQITLSGTPQPSNRENDARYYIENAPDALDTAGEWYLNRQTGVLYYRPQPNENIATAEVFAPFLPELVRMEGDFTAQKPVQHVVFRGLNFAHADWSLSDKGYADTQAAVDIRGALFAQGTVDSTVENCTFAHLGGYAIELGKGCQRDRLVGNQCFDLGGGGIRIGETQIRTVPFEANNGHIITDNLIYQGGLVFPAAGGIFILQSGGNRVAHNHVHHLYYTAISLGWTWGYQESPCHANIVEFNDLHHLGQEWLSDMGAVYTLGLQPGTIIRNNLIHDVRSFTYGGWGLYTDEGSTGILLENNVVYRCKSAGFHQHYGRENIVRNNIFALNQECQLMRSRAEEHLSFTFTNNIIYFDSGNLLGSNWSQDKYAMDLNIYFDARPNAVIKFSDASWEDWQKRGHDTHSLIEDPQFVAPQQYDFKLRDSSPALKMGFKPIDLSTVGVRPVGKRD